jgi:hypothetical protein
MSQWRPLTLIIDDAVRTSLTTSFRKNVNDLLSAGNEPMRLSRKQFWESVDERDSGQG